MSSQPPGDPAAQPDSAVSTQSDNEVSNRPSDDPSTQSRGDVTIQPDGEFLNTFDGLPDTSQGCITCGPQEKLISLHILNTHASLSSTYENYSFYT